MAKNSIRDYSATNSSNTDIQSIDISEGCSPAGINNAIREVMADLKDVSTGAVALESPAFDSASLTGDLTFGDNDKAVFGAGSDLQIYHDGSHSYIDEAGTGDIYVSVLDDVIFRTYGTNELVARFNTNQSTGGWARLYHRGSERLETTATGVDVTGTIKAKGGSTSTQTTNAGLIANSSGKFVVNHGNEYGLYTGYINSTNDAIGIASTTNAGTAGPLVLQPFGGNVGIGTASPVVPLHLKSSSPAVSLQASASKTSGNRADFNAYNSDVSSVGYIRFGAVTDNVGTDMQFAVRPAAGSLTEAMRLTSAGDFLVGATSFNYAAIGVGLRSSNYSYFTTSNAYPILVNRKSSVGILINFAYEDSSIGTISTNGVSTAYNTTSDYRLKTAVEYDWDATSRLKQLKPVRFNFIADADTTVDGFLAHEVQDVVPEAIVGEKDGMRDEEYQVSAATGDIYTPAVEATYDEDGAELTAAVNEVIHSADVERPDELEEGQQWRETTAAVMGTRSVPDYQGIDQSKLVPLLVKTIQELEARITALEAN